MEREIERFQPLLTAVHQVPAGNEAGAGVPAGGELLPNGLEVLVRAGAALRRALLVSLALLLVSLVELTVLILYPGPEVAVVWEEKSGKPLVEAP